MAAAATRAVGAASRRLGLGGGSVIGGHVGLALDPSLLTELARGRQVALVSGTNGKTTTTRLFAAAVARLAPGGVVATSGSGANLPQGLVSALAEAPLGAPAVLEVDEAYLGLVMTATAPKVIVLLNLSRDQLDRVSEVRMLATRWREALARAAGAVVVANADDPLVVWAAAGSANVVWVAAGELWRMDAAGCPACGGRVSFDGRGSFDGKGWACDCGFARPEPNFEVDGSDLLTRAGERLPIVLGIPGRFNRANASMAAVGAAALGIDLRSALDAMAPVAEVEGRYAVVPYGSAAVRMLLAKNPAGWTELLDMIEGDAPAVVIGINARVADGHDPSWLWDVPFEQLRGRKVVATGERCRDLGVRLLYGAVEHVVVPEQLEALGTAATWLGTSQVEYIGNYTAFQDLRQKLSRVHRHRSGQPGFLTGAKGVMGATGVMGIARPFPPRGTSADGLTDVRVMPAATRSGPVGSALRVVVVHPDLLGTYGDGGNALVLAERARRRGYAVEMVEAFSTDPLPETGDIYCIGGGEDAPQVEATEILAAEGSLARAHSRGAVLLAVCAGFQIIGTSFPGLGGQVRSGLGIVDVTTVRGGGRRAVGEVVSDPWRSEWSATAGEQAGIGLSGVAHTMVGSTATELWHSSLIERMTGFENHAGVTTLGAGVEPLGRVLVGVGNGTSLQSRAPRPGVGRGLDRPAPIEGRGVPADGAWVGKVIGTYLHGPVLARNPSLADALLQMATGDALPPLRDSEETALRSERFAAVLARRTRLMSRLGWRR